MRGITTEGYLKTIPAKFKKCLNWLDRRPVLQLIIIANILNLVIEMLSRKSAIEGVRYLLDSPLVFEYNALIILLTLSLSLLVSKKNFALLGISAVWLGLGIANCILLNYRITPLAATDFKILRSVWEIIGDYLEIWQIILICAGILAFVSVVVIIGKKAPKRKVQYAKAVATVTVLTLALVLCTNVSLKAHAISTSFGNLADAYEEYGFAYCFSSSVIDRGINRPEGYSEEKIRQVLKDIQAYRTGIPAERPNIVFLQLESFYDVNYYRGLSFTRNPVPVFTQLKSLCPSGFLTVPAIGAGTANTEFEVITGMSLDFFGAGEYPYKTIMQSATCESICYNLKELGYRCHAIHNHSGTFYDRNKVYPNLGFDAYTSLEYMDNVELNPTGWAKDGVLAAEIMKVLQSTEKKDFIYAISVQAHGKYPHKVVDEEQKIAVSGIEDEEDRIAFEYYVNQLSETDAFVGSLVAALSNYDEPVLVVIFGDHLPNFETSEDDVETGNIYQTEYVVWSNYDNNGFEKARRDLYSYQLGAYVMGRLDMETGLLTKLHQRYSSDPEYQEYLELLEYDMLYGDLYAYGGQCPYEPADMKMGTEDIELNGACVIGDCLYVSGGGFTKWSKVCIDGEEMDTVYVDKTILKVESAELEPGSVITVAQVGKNGEALSRTEEYMFK